MAKKESKPKKLVVITGTGPIKELGKISAPILNPCLLDMDTIVRLIHGRRRVYEVNPDNRQEKVLLTLSNVYLTNFKQKDKEVATTKAATTEVKSTTAKKEAVVEQTVEETKKEAVKSDFTKK